MIIDFFKGGTTRYQGAKTYSFSYDLSDDEGSWDVQNLVAVARNYDTIVIAVYDWASANLAQRLRSLNKKVIIFSVLSPVYVLNGFDWVDSIICGYSYSSYSFSAMWGVLNGEIEAQGKIPLKLAN